MTAGEARLTALGHYEIDRPLGAGGMGEVYLAHSPSGRAVALKVIREELATRPGFRERFAREVQAARQVSGAFTAPVLDADTKGEVPWMATAYVDGPTLASVVAEQAPLSADETWRLASGLCEALRDIHRAGLVHRDLKPGNILLAEDGPRVIDFGISRVVDATALTQSGQILGTPLFMAPEQFRTPRDAGPAADVFALGAVLVYAATGHGPFDGDTPYAIAWNAVHEDPDLTNLPDSLRPVVLPCLAKDPAARPTPETLLTLLSSRRTRRTSAKAAETRRLRVTRRRIALAAGAVLCAGAVTAGAWTWWPGGGTTDRATGPAPTTTRATPEPTPTPTPVRMPGWEPWTAQLKRVDRLADMPGCSYEFPALWCGGGDTLMARLDARTGKILWQEPADGFGTTDMSFTQDGVYSLTSGYVNEVPHHTVRRFDAETGKLEAERTVTGSHECHLAEEYLLCLQDGDVIATTTPDQKASRWTVEGRWTEMIQSRAQEPGGDATYVVRAGSSVRYAEEIGELVPGGGEVAWSLKLPPRSAVHSATNDFVYLRSSDTDGTPAFRQLDRRTGTMTSVRLYRSEQPLGVAEGVLYTQRDGGVISAYNLTTEKRLWSVTTLQRELSVPTVGGGRVHFTGLDGTVIVLDQNTGVVLWPRKLPTGSVSEGTGSGRIAARPVVLGDIVIAPAPGGRIRSFLAPAATS